MIRMLTTRSAAAGLLAAAGLFVAGCSSPSEGGTAPADAPKQSGLKNFDACTVLKSSDLQSHGLPLKGEPDDQGIGEVGCTYENDELILGVLKAEGHDMAYWNERRGNFDVFVPNQVGSHHGIRNVVTGAKGTGTCAQYVIAGGGSVIIDITFSSSQMAGKDPCAKAMEFAELIEPRLPE